MRYITSYFVVVLYRLKFVLLCMLSFSLSYTVVYAAEKDDLLDVPLESLLVMQVSVASKTEEQLGEAPSSVTVFTRQQLSRMGVKSVEALLNFVPGFTTSRETVFGQGYTVSARGSTTPQASYNILFMLDGQRLNGDLGGGALDYNHLISLYNVKQVEIIRGPGSALYGTGAFSGVVNIITETDANEVFVGAGDMDSREAYFNVSKKGKDWHVAASARYFEDAGQTYTHLIDPYVASTQDPRQGDDGNLSINYKDLKFTLQHSSRDFTDFYVASSLGNGNNSFESDRNAAFFRYNLVDNKESSWSLEGGYTEMGLTTVEEAYSQRTMEELSSTVNTTGKAAVLKITDSTEHAWNIGINGRQQWNKEHGSSIGIQWYNPVIDEYHQLSNYNLRELNNALFSMPPSGTVTYYDGIVEDALYNKDDGRDILGIYLQHKYQPIESLDITLGSRYDRYSDFGNTVNPRLAVVYSLSDTTKLKGMYGEAFRAPSIRQLSTPLLGNRDLKPEKIKTLELAWLQQHNGFQTALTYFHSRSQDKIDTVLVAPNSRRFMNLDDKLTTDGWELEASTDVFYGISLRAAYSLLNHTEENPRRFPKQTFSFIANYHHEDWNINISSYFNDEVEQQVTSGEFITLDSYWVTDMNVRYEFAKNMTAIGKVDNLLDEEYYSSSKNSAFNEGLINRGRSYSLGLEVTF
ncbi:TonB-dependent receptor plug domain-containing protein [Beggiatoa leptomitoformis]|nr:TonB-dependent receptor [Beggiatoa leptomitoformis]